MSVRRTRLRSRTSLSPILEGTVVLEFNTPASAAALPTVLLPDEPSPRTAVDIARQDSSNGHGSTETTGTAVTIPTTSSASSSSASTDDEWYIPSPECTTAWHKALRLCAQAVMSGKVVEITRAKLAAAKDAQSLWDNRWEAIHNRLCKGDKNPQLEDELLRAATKLVQLEVYVSNLSSLLDNAVLTDKDTRHHWHEAQEVAQALGPQFKGGVVVPLPDEAESLE